MGPNFAKRDHKMQVPHLKTALTGPLLALEEHFLSKQIAIETWLRKQWQLTPPAIYGSVDIRNAGFKVAPIDMNLFPAGFNNLNPDFMPLCIQAAQNIISKALPHCVRILIVPESHTRNLFYFESLSVLQSILMHAGFEVRIGSLSDEITEPKTIALPSNKEITLEPLQRRGNKVMVENFMPCLVLMNNDLSSGVPDILQNLEQTIRPPIELGWDRRLKSVHFQHYDSVASEFAKAMGLDSWLIKPLFENCGCVDFQDEKSRQCLTEKSEKLFDDISDHYKKNQIKADPFVIVKADAGTYGMAVMSIKSPAEMSTLNRKQRTRMTKSKGGQPVTKVILQEGVHSFERWEGAVAEPVVYMIGEHVIGGFYRMHAGKESTESLNTPGMQFEPLAFAKCCNSLEKSEEHNRFYLYGVIARLSMLAAAKERQEFVNQ